MACALPSEPGFLQRGFYGLGFRVWGLGFRVWGLGFRDIEDLFGLYWDMGKKMNTTFFYHSGVCIGDILGLCWGCNGRMESKMETTIQGLGL